MISLVLFFITGTFGLYHILGPKILCVVVRLQFFFGPWIYDHSLIFKVARILAFPIIDWFSGLETTQPNIWNFLNKGTHEESDRDDFDTGIVKEILAQTLLLDEKVKGKWEKKIADAV